VSDSRTAIEEAFTATRAIAIHVAGHAVMARIVPRPFRETRVVDIASYGDLHHALPEWTEHGDGVPVLGQVTLTKRLMVCLAGTLTEAAWVSGAGTAPSGTEEIAALGAVADQLAARMVAAHTPGTAAVKDAYIEYVRQLVMTQTGTAYFPRPIAGDATLEGGAVLHRRFWFLVYGLADAVEHAGTISWAKTRTLLKQLERDDLDLTLRNIKKNRTRSGGLD
jgi:hypothetical protein